MNEMFAPPVWAQVAVAGLPPEAAVRELLGAVRAALLRELAERFAETAFAMTDDRQNIIVRWDGGPAALDVANQLDFEWVEEQREAVLGTVICFEPLVWPEALEILVIVFKRS